MSTIFFQCFSPTRYWFLGNFFSWKSLLKSAIKSSVDETWSFLYGLAHCTIGGLKELVLQNWIAKHKLESFSGSVSYSSHELERILRTRLKRFVNLAPRALQYFLTKHERSEAFVIGFFVSILSYSFAFFIGRCRTHGTNRRNWCQGRNGTFPRILGPQVNK